MALTEAEELELLSLERNRANASAAPAGGGGTLFSVTKQDLSNMARPVLELGGAMVGGGIGAGVGAVAIPGVGSVPGAFAGGATGLATGRAAADLLDRTMGLKKPIQSVGEGVTEAASDLGSGVAMELGGKAVGRAMEAIPGAAKATGKGLLSVLFGPPVKDIEARFANNEAIRTAKPFDVLARELPDDLHAFAETVRKKSDAALDLLSTSKAIAPVGNAATLEAEKAGVQQTRAILQKKIAEAETQYAATKNFSGQPPKVTADYKAYVQSLKDKLSGLNDPVLDQGGATPRADLLAAVNQEVRGLGRAIAKTTVQAKAALAGYAKRLSDLGPTASQSELGHIVRDIDNDINWEDKAAKPLNSALEGLRTRIDTILKAGNPEYASAMEPVAEGTRIIKKGQKVFNLQRVAGEGYQASNSTATNLRTALKEGRVDSQDVLDAIKAVTGRDYLQAGENAAVAERFARGATNGSRRVNLGAALGAGAGGLIHGAGGGVAGATLGALGGGYMDQEGPRVAGSIIDQLVQLSRGATSPAPSPQLQKAIAAATNYLMMRGQPIRP